MPKTVKRNSYGSLLSHDKCTMHMVVRMLFMHLRQSRSSEKSLQSYCPSHLRVDSMHSPEPQVNSTAEHLRGCSSAFIMQHTSHHMQTSDNCLIPANSKSSSNSWLQIFTYEASTKIQIYMLWKWWKVLYYDFWQKYKHTITTILHVRKKIWIARASKIDINALHKFALKLSINSHLLVISKLKQLSTINIHAK